jgi:hypothetical protein
MDGRLFAKTAEALSVLYRARICRPFKESRNRLPPGGPVQQPYLPARQHRLVESISRNRFLVSIKVYKYGLCTVLRIFSDWWIFLFLCHHTRMYNVHCTLYTSNGHANAMFWEVLHLLNSFKEIKRQSHETDGCFSLGSLLSVLSVLQQIVFQNSGTD